MTYPTQPRGFSAVPERFARVRGPGRRFAGGPAICAEEARTVSAGHGLKRHPVGEPLFVSRIESGPGFAADVAWRRLAQMKTPGAVSRPGAAPEFQFHE
jgi:hypothetical protein